MALTAEGLGNVEEYVSVVAGLGLKAEAIVSNHIWPSYPDIEILQ